MNAQGEDILAFLDRAITAREHKATEAAHEHGADWYYDDGFVLGRREDDMVATGSQDFLERQQGAHIALNDPASVLRRCAADRKLLTLHRPQQTGAGFPDIQECRTCSADSLGDGYQYLMPAPCPSLLALAEGYGWTEGER